MFYLTEQKRYVFASMNHKYLMNKTSEAKLENKPQKNILSGFKVFQT